VGTAATTVATGPAAVPASSVPTGVRPGRGGSSTAGSVASGDEGSVRPGRAGVAVGGATGRRFPPGRLIVGVAVGVARAAAVGVVVACGVPVARSVGVALVGGAAACGVLVGLAGGARGGVRVRRGSGVAREGRALTGRVVAVAVGDAGAPEGSPCGRTVAVGSAAPAPWPRAGGAGGTSSGVVAVCVGAGGRAGRAVAAAPGWWRGAARALAGARCGGGIRRGRRSCPAVRGVRGTWTRGLPRRTIRAGGTGAGATLRGGAAGAVGRRGRTGAVVRGEAVTVAAWVMAIRVERGRLDGAGRTTPRPATTVARGAAVAGGAPPGSRTVWAAGVNR